MIKIINLSSCLITIFTNMIAVLCSLIRAILKTFPSRNIYNDFIMSMSCSNFLASMVCWINIYRLTFGFNDFQLPAFFCKVNIKN